MYYISDETISQNGVVSQQCAMEMATNVRNELDSDIGISFTGVAGPDEQEGKPVGTVFIGISYRDGTFTVERVDFLEAGAQIRIRTLNTAVIIYYETFIKFEEGFFLKALFLFKKLTKFTFIKQKGFK